MAQLRGTRLLMHTAQERKEQQVHKVLMAQQAHKAQQAHRESQAHKG